MCSLSCIVLQVPIEEEGDADKEAVKIRPEGGMQVLLSVTAVLSSRSWSSVAPL